MTTQANQNKSEENENLYQKNSQALLEFIDENFLDSRKRLNSNKLKREPKILEALYGFVDKIPNKEKLSLRDLIWCVRNNFNEMPKCQTCGKEIPLKVEWANKNYPGGYIRKFCSLKCFNNNPEVKTKASAREKAKAKERLEKRKETIIKKYGSWENRPGGDNFKKSNEKLKTDPIFREQRKQKTTNTNLKKYGSKWTTQIKEFQDKRKSTNLEKYGYENPIILHSKIGAQKIKEKNIFEKFNFNNEQKKNWDKSEFWKKEFIIKDKINIKKAQEYFNINDYYLLYGKFKRLIGEEEFSKYSTRSHYEDELINFINSIYQGSINKNDRQLIKPKELDIYIPEKNLAIEFDGLYWHSFNQKILVNDFKYKHLEKTRACEEKGINLLHIFENEWLDPIKQDIWKSIISYKLGIVKQRYFARKLEIVTDLNNNFIKNFYDINHIQGGSAPSPIKIGLYDPKTGKVVSIMTFGKSRYNRNIEYELIRFASLKYTACVGCAQRILKYFLKNHKPKSMISYANRRWASSLSNVYKTLGFKFIREAEPNYYYFKLDDPDLRLYPRVTFQKHKLENHVLTKDFYKSNLTETEIMFNAGFRRIYDSGNLVYEWEVK